MKKKIKLFIALITLLTWTKLQGQSTCDVTTVGELVSALQDPDGCPSVHILNNLDLSDLDPCDLPLIIGDEDSYVELYGDFDLFCSPAGDDPDRNYLGTTVYSPYYSAELCSELHGHNSIDLFVFELRNGIIHNLRIQGPRSDLKDENYFKSPRPCSTPLSLKEGVASCIIVWGDQNEVSNCEIFGFNKYGIQVYTTNDPNTSYDGAFYCRYNYIHNNKGFGYGYGVWMGGMGYTECPANATDDHTNFNAGEQIVHFYQDIFLDNRHDIAGKGDRNSYDILECTFSRKSINEHIDRHNGGTTGNPVTVNNRDASTSTDYSIPPQSGTPSCVNTTPCTSNTLLCCHFFPDIDDVGGKDTYINRSIFYSGGLAIAFPNINPCLNQTGTEGIVDIRDNKFPADPSGRIKIGEWSDITPGNGWFDSDNPDLSGHFNDMYNDNTFQTPPAQAPLVPEVDFNWQGYSTPPVTHLDLVEGDNVRFDNNLCDYQEISHDDCNAVFFYRFHEMPDDLTDEMRINEGSTISHTFNNMGIVNLNLMAIQKTNYHASDIAKQLVVVKPDVSTHPGRYLVVHWKDTYTGNFLPDGGSCSDNCRKTVVTDIDLTVTNFKKYIEINGTRLTLPNSSDYEDIAGDDGWERIFIDISDLELDTPCHTGNGNGDIDILEIGIEIPTGLTANFEQVHGFYFMVDDVYINDDNGDNAIGYADFEDKTNATISNAEDLCENGKKGKWFMGSTGYHQCNNTANSSIIKNLGFRTYDPRSGFQSFNAEIMPNAQDYPEGKYAFIRQCFNVHCDHIVPLDPDRKGEISENPGFEIYPNPVSRGGILTGELSGHFDQQDQHTISIYSTDGNLLTGKSFSSQKTELMLDLAPGIYCAKIVNGKQTDYKKIVVIN